MKMRILVLVVLPFPVMFSFGLEGDFSLTREEKKMINSMIRDYSPNVIEYQEFYNHLKELDTMYKPLLSKEELKAFRIQYLEIFRSLYQWGKEAVKNIEESYAKNQLERKENSR